MSDSNISHQTTSDDDERRNSFAARESELSLQIKRDELRWAPIWRALTLIVVIVSFSGICWIVPRFIADRKALAILRIEADIRIAELHARAIEASKAVPPQARESLASVPEISTKAREAFDDAVKISIEQANQPSTAGRVVATVTSILDQLVKAGKATRNEAGAITRQLIKAGIDVTKDVLTEFGKTGVHLLLDEKKDDAGKSGTSITGNVVNYLSCAAPAEKKVKESASPSPPRPPNQPKKPASCPAIPAKNDLPAKTTDSF